MRSEKRKKELGEVFTPASLVNEMLDKIPQEELLDPKKTVLDNSCGNGNFLVAVLERRLKSGMDFHDAIKTIYGVDISVRNVQETRERLAGTHADKLTTHILDINIICADALDPSHTGWKDVGYFWANMEHNFWGPNYAI